jgi:hypothetical protein
MREKTIRHPQCPKCHGFSRHVRRTGVFPKEALTLEYIFYCFKCKLFARAGREGTPLEGMGNKALHKLRQRTLDWFETSGMTQSNFQAEMDRTPWEMDVLHWDRKTCVRAINTVLNEKVSPAERELLS